MSTIGGFGGLGGMAARAYATAAGVGTPPAASATETTTKASFTQALEEAAKSSIDTLRQGEQQTLAAAQGKADLLDVVHAVNAADSTLQTVVAVRDRVIQAYQEIVRMPI